MLSLVAYQSSDESGSDAEEISDNKAHRDESIKVNSIKDSTSILSSAVQPKSKEAVKITVPSLKEFEDDEKGEPSNKKLKKSSGSGLTSILPPPKYSKPATSQNSFMPYVLTKKQVPSSISAASSMHSTNSKKLSGEPKSSSKPLVKTECHFKKEPAVTEDEDQTLGTDFFSLQEPKCSFPTPVNSKLKSLDESSRVIGGFHQNNSHTEASSVLPESSTTTSWSDQTSTTHVQYAEATSSAQNYCVGSYSENESLISGSSAGYSEISPDTTTEHATDERFLKLQGKKRKGQEEINFIDVNLDDQLSDKTQWLTKSITEEVVHRPSRKKNDMPTQLQKRKHQITYLAFQAKERELELKNQWSQNRLTKRETQAKYGF